MNTNLVPFFIRLNQQLSKNTVSFSNDERNIALSWYQKYMGNTEIEDNRLIDILCFFYDHIDLDSYQHHQYLQLASYSHKTYNIPQEKLLLMLADFRELV